MLTTPEVLEMLKLDCSVMHYEWGKLGKSSKVAQLAKLDVDSQQPTAELWMGTHVNAPSTCNGKLLSQILLQDPSLLGSLDSPSGQLPFLFKVLSINKALSIQAHPDKVSRRFQI